VTDAPPALPRFAPGDGLRARFPADLAADAVAIAAVANASLAAVHANRRPDWATSPIHGRSRPIVVSGP
jgi:hypothetical protein